MSVSPSIEKEMLDKLDACFSTGISDTRMEYVDSCYEFLDVVYSSASQQYRTEERLLLETAASSFLVTQQSGSVLLELAHDRYFPHLRATFLHVAAVMHYAVLMTHEDLREHRMSFEAASDRLCKVYESARARGMKEVDCRMTIEAAWMHVALPHAENFERLLSRVQRTKDEQMWHESVKRAVEFFWVNNKRPGDRVRTRSLGAWNQFEDDIKHAQRLLLKCGTSPTSQRFQRLIADVATEVKMDVGELLKMYREAYFEI